MAHRGRVAVMVLALAGTLAASQASAAEAHRWVQYVPGGIEARALTDGPACPAATLDGAPAAMQPRAAPGEGYPILACALSLPPGTRAATVDSVPLRLPAADPRRILVLADTGCRMKGAKVQACNDITQWPFRVIAAVAATTRPDLVLHLGDYHYRETACPAGNAGCAGSPYGDNWAVWRADFFDPAAPLLAAAPWVMVRGNHEECDRGGKGWSRTLDPRPFDLAAGCIPGNADPYAVALPGLTLGVMDVATADGDAVSIPQANAFRRAFEAVGEAMGRAGGQAGHQAEGQAASGQPGWLLLHRPIWSGEEMKNGQAVGANRTLAAAALDGSIPATVSAMFSGHHHTFAVLNYDPAAGLPPQVIAGHGGNYADEGLPADPAGMNILGVRVASGINQHGYGFLLLERGDAGWTATSHDMRGNPVRTCTVGIRQVTCGPQRPAGG